MSCEVIVDPRFVNGAPIFYCGSGSGLCNRCGLPSDYSPCGVCALLRTDRLEALALARDLKFEIGPFCRFCESDEETKLCDWPEMKPAPKRTELAEVGDAWITQKNHRRSRIVGIENLNRGRGREVVPEGGYGRRIWVLIPKHPKPYPYDYCNHNGTFTTETPGTCDRQCCWRHHREVGEDRHYCKDHWDSWLTGLKL